MELFKPSFTLLTFLISIVKYYLAYLHITQKDERNHVVVFASLTEKILISDEQNIAIKATDIPLVPHSSVSENY